MIHTEAKLLLDLDLLKVYYSDWYILRSFNLVSILGLGCYLSRERKIIIVRLVGQSLDRTLHRYQSNPNSFMYPPALISKRPLHDTTVDSCEGRISAKIQSE